jgi:hypothetical protein
MPTRYQKHYTRDQARALLPQVRQWLKQLSSRRVLIDHAGEQLAKMMEPGLDLGGELVDRWVRHLAAFQDVLAEFYRREIQIKDLDRGLLDFPAFVGGKEVFLCWEEGEDDIEFWHDLDAGYAGRERLDE